MLPLISDLLAIALMLLIQPKKKEDYSLCIHWTLINLERLMSVNLIGQ